MKYNYKKDEKTYKELNRDSCQRCEKDHENIMRNLRKKIYKF